MSKEEAEGDSADSQPRCEIEKTLLEKTLLEKTLLEKTLLEKTLLEKTLLGGMCQRPAEVRYREALLCEPHAALLTLEERAEAVLGSVFRMDEWLEENGDSSSDEEFVGRIRREREEAVAAFRLTRTQIRDARRALSVG
jgi:hypothetical protein